jgi:hypothetical protein
MSTIKKPIKRKEYEKALRKLQVERCRIGSRKRACVWS